MLIAVTFWCDYSTTICVNRFSRNTHHQIFWNHQIQFSDVAEKLKMLLSYHPTDLYPVTTALMLVLYFTHILSSFLVSWKIGMCFHIFICLMFIPKEAKTTFRHQQWMPFHCFPSNCTTTKLPHTYTYNIQTIICSICGWFQPIVLLTLGQNCCSPVDNWQLQEYDDD